MKSLGRILEKLQVLDIPKKLNQNNLEKNQFVGWNSLLFLCTKEQSFIEGVCEEPNPEVPVQLFELFFLPFYNFYFIQGFNFCFVMAQGYVGIFVQFRWVGPSPFFPFMSIGFMCRAYWVELGPCPSQFQWALGFSRCHQVV